MRHESQRWPSLRGQARHLAPLALLVGGCAGPSQVITVQRDVWQAAVVPPPEGAVAVGPLVEQGGLTAEGGLSGVVAVTSDETRQEGALGHLTSLGGGHLRVAGRIDEVVELGLAGELLPGPLVAPTAADLEDTDGGVGFILRGGPQLRVAAPLGGGVAFTLDGDLRLNPVSVQRDIEVRVVDQYESSAGWQFQETVETDRERWTRWPVLPRVGTGLAWTGDGLHLAGSLVVQQALVVPGLDSVTWQCVNYDTVDPQAWCEGPSMPPIIERAWLPTASLSAGARLGRSWVLAQGWVHLAEDDAGVAASAPAGAMISLRMPLFAPRPAPEPAVAGWRQVAPPAGAPPGWQRVDVGAVPPGWRMVRPPTAPTSPAPLAIPAGTPPPPLPPPPPPPQVTDDEHAPPPE